MPALPTGTITFLFTDIEGSSQLWERYPEAMRQALERHDSALRAVCEFHNGYIFKTMGDAFCVAFSTPVEALTAALDAQLALQQLAWPETSPISVRMGLHTGVAQQRANDYFGQTVNRVARLQGIGHGQQILISQATYELVKSHLPADATLNALGTHRLKGLASTENVWQLAHPALPQEFPPLNSLGHLPTNLPTQLTSFIGREKEIAEVIGRLSSSRLLTLTGSGGCGKTRLSLQVAEEVLERYADGVWLVELAGLTDSDLLSQTVAEALKIREKPGEPISKTLITALADKHLLLVLDNCEHLLESSAQLVDSILKSCLKVSVLASSREAMGLAGETAYRVPSMSAPPPEALSGPSRGAEGLSARERLQDYESIRLFCERAVSVKTDFVVTHQNAAALVSVCHQLDGMPLAIELAAARVRALPVEEISVRLDRRFHLLKGGSRTALPRHQTLRSLIDWSYDLLTEPERILLERVSVFEGGFQLAAAEKICAGDTIEEIDVLDLVTSLVDKSLLVYVERHGRARYRLLETVRQYATDRAEERGGLEKVLRNRRDYFLALAQEADNKFYGPEQVAWTQRLDAEHDNMRAALKWSLAEDADTQDSLLLCGALQNFWMMRGYVAEAREWCRLALSIPGSQERTQARGRVFNGAGQYARAQGDYPSAWTFLKEGLEIRREIGDRNYIGSPLHNMGLLAYEQGDYALARTYWDESAALFREIKQWPFLADSLNCLGMMANGLGEYTGAIGYLKEALNIYREYEEQVGIGAALHNLGDVATSQGDYAVAQAYYEESAALFRELGHRDFLANSLFGLGIVATRLGDYPAAWAYLTECLTISREIGNRKSAASALLAKASISQAQRDYLQERAYLEESLALAQEIGTRTSIIDGLHAMASLSARTSNPTRAAILWGASERLREETGFAFSVAMRDQYEKDVADARRGVAEQAFENAWTDGRGMTQAEAVTYALEKSRHTSA